MNQLDASLAKVFRELPSHVHSVQGISCTHQNIVPVWLFSLSPLRERIARTQARRAHISKQTQARKITR